MLTGCATQPSSVSSDQQQQHVYSNASAAALAFDPPVSAGTQQLDLSRDGREEAAYAGYQESSTTYYDLHQDDRQIVTDNSGGRMLREATSDTFGVSSR